MKKFLFLLNLFCLFAAPLIAQSLENLPQYIWKFQTSAQADDNFFKLQQEWAQNIKVMTRGQIDISLFPIDRLVPYDQTLDAITAKVIDGHMASTSYFSHKDPAFALLGDLIGAFEHPFQMQKFLEYRGGNALYRKLLAPYGLYFIGGAWTGKESIVSTKPIRTVADFKGIRIRSPEGLAQEVFYAVGAIPVKIPLFETHSALKAGLVDAADYTVFSTNHELGLHDVAKYPIYPGIHSMPVIEISMNLEIWNRLTPDLQTILTIATRELARNMVQQLELLDSLAIAEAKQQSVEIIKWSDEERKKFRQIAQKQWEKWSRRSPMAMKIYKSVIAYLKSEDLL